MVKRISLYLDSWKSALLSKGGMLTLLKTTLVSIPNYYLSLFTIPVSVANKIESFFRKFLWNDSKDYHRYLLVDWKTICTPMDGGGLRVRSIKSHNRVLLAKWF